MIDAAGVPRVALLAIGDELLSGQQLDTNSSWLSERMSALGWRVHSVSLLGDDEAAIGERLAQLVERVDLIVVTGGLTGVNFTWLASPKIAAATARELVLDAGALEGIRAIFAARGLPMAASNERQALVPAQAVPMANPCGTAPGFRVLHDSGCWIAAFPGPPRELYPMFTQEFEPWLGTAFPARSSARVAAFFLFGMPESEFAVRGGEWMARDASPRIGVCASGRVLKVRIDGSGAITEDVHRSFELRVEAFRERFADAIFSEGSPDTALALAEQLLRRKISFACAESCTGGEIASRLIAMPGISDVFLEGFVTYSDAAKIARLGVAPKLLETHGAVSSEVAAAMAAGAAAVSGARLASTAGCVRRSCACRTAVEI